MRIIKRKQLNREMKKSKSSGVIFSVIIAAVLLAATFTACGKSEFGVTENTEKKMTITAENADKDAFFIAGSLEAEDGDEIEISAGLEKGSVRVEIIAAPEESIDELPEIDGEAIISGNLSNRETVSGTVPAGSYMVKATCLEKATGTVQIEVKE